MFKIVISILYSDSYFNAFKDLIEGETDKQVQVDTAVVVFKKNLWKSIELSFSTNWDEVQIDTSLMQLEASKANAKDQEKKWRPTNIPVEDQVRPKIARELKKQKCWFEHQIKYQDQGIAGLILDVEQLRRNFREKSAKRDQLIAQIREDRENFKGVEQIQVINKELER